MQNERLLLSQHDLQHLSALVKKASAETAELLEAELSRAEIVPETPTQAVALNSTVRYLDLETQRESTVTLVFPEHADTAQGRISVIAPIGAALIGLRVGQSIEWPLPGGRVKRIQVVGVSRDED